MAFVYEVNGQRVEFEREPTDADIDEAARSLGSTPAKYQPPQTPTSAMPKPVEGSGGAAFGVYRPAGRRPESQQDREAAKEMPLQTARGVVTGTLGAIPDLANLPGTVYGAVTGNEPGYRVPGGSEDWNQILPGESNTPHARLARFAGEALAPVPTVKGIQAGAQALGEGARMAGQAVKTAGQGAVDLGRGALRGVAYPGGTAADTALLPIKPNYVPHEQVAEFMAGNRPASTLTEMPTADLINQTTGGRWAYGMAPKNAAGERLVPAQGRLMEGIGENIGAGIRTNPLQGLLDIGGLVTAGTPVGSLLRGIPAGATSILNKATNFEPGFPAARAAALAQEGRAGLQAAMPQTPLLPRPAGPVRPTPTMYVAPGGQATTNLAGTQTNYTPPAPQSASFNQVRRELTPAETSQQAAAAKIQNAAPVMTPEGQAKLDAIRARGAQAETDRATRMAALQQRAQAAGGYTPPMSEAPVAPVGMPETPPAPTNTLDTLRNRLTPMTAEEQAAVDAYNAKSPVDKAAETRAKNKAPKDVSQILTGDQADFWRTLRTKTQTLPDGSTVKTYPINESGTITASDKTMPDTGYGEQAARSVRNKDVGLYNEVQRGPDIVMREVQVPGMTIVEETGFAYVKGQTVPRKTVEVRQGNRVDVYSNGKYVQSETLNGEPLPAPRNKTIPDIDSWIKKIKGE